MELKKYLEPLKKLKCSISDCKCKVTTIYNGLPFCLLHFHQEKGKDSGHEIREQARYENWIKFGRRKKTVQK